MIGAMLNTIGLITDVAVVVAVVVVVLAMVVVDVAVAVAVAVVVEGWDVQLPRTRAAIISKTPRILISLKPFFMII